MVWEGRREEQEFGFGFGSLMPRLSSGCHKRGVDESWVGILVTDLQGSATQSPVRVDSLQPLETEGVLEHESAVGVHGWWSSHT